MIYRVGRARQGTEAPKERQRQRRRYLNYDRGIVSNAAKFTSDLDLGYRNFGLCSSRQRILSTLENENGTRERTDPLSAEATAMVGKDIDMLDAYATGAFESR